ncbi:MAG: helix-hairpin-helix domain-containing protein [Erysipelotrichaceae bacterium]|nr:helix-hairpin-helix domain-containing protein [Erysipelotrichaceae bacterium]
MLKKILLLILIFLLFLFGTFWASAPKINTLQERNVEVYYNEKIYSLPVGSTLKDLENLCKESIDITYISDDYILKDGDCLVEEDSKNLISINSDDIDVLCRLPGIGKATANKIIEYRRFYGDFTSIEEIKNISGIGEKKYEILKELISV